MSANGTGRLNPTELREALRLARGSINPMSSEARLLRKVRDALDVEEAAGRHMSRHERRLCEFADALTWNETETRHPEYAEVDRDFHDEHTTAMAHVAERRLRLQEQETQQLVITTRAVEALRQEGAVTARLRAQLDAAKESSRVAREDVRSALGALLRVEQRRDNARRGAVIASQAKSKAK